MAKPIPFKVRAQRLREYAIYRLLTPVRLVVEWWMRRQRLVLLYCVSGNGIGDALALSTILDSLHRQRGDRAIIFSKHPQLFWHNPNVALNIGYDNLAGLSRSLLKTLCRSLRGDRVICFGGEVWTLGTSPLSIESLDDRRNKQWVWLTHMLPDNNVDLDPKTAVPQIYFSAQEISAFEAKYAMLPECFALLKATVGTDRPRSTMMKNWDLSRIQDAVTQTPHYHWVQIGDKNEPLVTGAINLLGATSLREALYLLSRAQLIFSVEGFLTHAAAAFNTPCVVPFTGIHQPRGLIYPNTFAVLPDPEPPCMPCWQEVCTVDGMPCRNHIFVTAVLSRLNRAWAHQSPEPLNAI